MKSSLQLFFLIVVLGTVAYAAFVKANALAARSYLESVEECLETLSFNDLQALDNDDRVRELLDAGSLDPDQSKAVVEFFASTKNCELDAAPSDLWVERGLRLKLLNGQRLVLEQTY